jgi:hypothetical protein
LLQKDRKDLEALQGANTENLEPFADAAPFLGPSMNFIELDLRIARLKNLVAIPGIIAGRTGRRDHCRHPLEGRRAHAAPHSSPTTRLQPSSHAEGDFRRCTSACVCDPALCVVPEDRFVRDIEGWTIGTDPTSIRPATASHSQAKIPRPTTAKAQPEASRERLCPACQKKTFVRWPWGWDGHAAHGCSSIAGDTPEERKRAYRERYLG